jgi:hypothetical protein
MFHGLSLMVGFLVLFSPQMIGKAQQPDKVDYAYRHDIQGTVTNRDDFPFEKVTVTRMTKDGKPISSTTSDSNGVFSFVDSGKGPKPQRTQKWWLVAEHRFHKKVDFKFDALWKEPGKKAKEYGYIKKDIVIKLSECKYTQCFDLCCDKGEVCSHGRFGDDVIHSCRRPRY